VVTFIKKIYWFVFRLFAPPICYSCSMYVEEGEILCARCVSFIYPVAPIYTSVGSYKIGVYAFSKYYGPMRPMILSKKYGNRAAFYGLAELMSQQKVLQGFKVDYWIPVPLHWTRRLHRGFNQSEILAEKLQSVLGGLVFKETKRLRKTQFQSSLSKENRIKNVQAVFSISEKKILKNQHVIIVDDLYTTGATVISLAREIAKCKPASIQVVVIAR
jgi:competence protein ComFC